MVTRGITQLVTDIFEFSCISKFSILPALTYNGSQPLNVNDGRIPPGFGTKFGNAGELNYRS